MSYFTKVDTIECALAFASAGEIEDDHFPGLTLEDLQRAHRKVSARLDNVSKQRAQS